MSNRPHVALLIETSRGHGRQIIEGVARYAAEHGSWLLRLGPRNIDDRPPRWLRTWQGDGIIEVLAKRMKGRRIARRTMMPPRGVVTRLSTDMIAVDDPEAAAAIRFIRENACQPVTAEEVARSLSPRHETLGELQKG